MDVLPIYFAGLNKKQLAAAQHRQGRALVSAGAGTGKTKTLVARYLSLLLDAGPDAEQPVSVHEILAITYTNAGADEIKQRVIEELNSLGQTALANQMNQAWIATIHGFCSRLLRRYALEANIDPSFKQADEVQAKNLQVEALNQLFDQLAIADAPQTIQQTIQQTIEQTEQQETIQQQSQLCLDDYLLLRETFSDFALRKHIADLHQQLRQGGLRTFDDLSIDKRIGLLQSLSGKKTFKLLIDDQRDQARALSVTTLLLRFVVAFADIYQQLCREQSLLDYNELLLLTSELLNNEDICRELQAQFAFTLIDEAQDSNALQMEIITKIAGDNLYQVGDSKQSIYGFQGADVSVLQEYHDSLKGEGNLFELTDNYRSDAGILNFANALFGTKELLGYRATALKAHRPADANALAEPVQILEIGPAIRDEVPVSYGDDCEPVSVTKLDKTLIATTEAAWIADHFQAEQQRGRSWADFMVLVQKRSHGQTLLREFKRRGMPALLRGGCCLLDAQVVKDARLFLDVVGRPRDPELFIKCLLSPLGRVSDQGIFEIAALRRAQGHDYLWDAALQAQAEDVLSDQQDRLALTGLLHSITEAREMVGSRPLSEIIARGLSARELDLHYLSQGALAGRQALATFQQFLRLADSWQAQGKDPLSFASELRQQRALGLFIQQDAVSLPGEECITIDTIHSSKGREYPVVALPLALSLKTRPKREAIMLHQLTERLGLFLRPGDCVLTRRDSKERPVYESHNYEKLFEKRCVKDQLEAIRLLYVACTRAEEKLLISYSIDTTGDGLSDAMNRGMNAAAKKMHKLQEQGSLKVEYISDEEQKEDRDKEEEEEQ
ncbi:MAG: UvrD-helicase domain-containing protein [Coriobacteriia bacterium]|nr:UvrD-helicase domain-containing protein [Coriobacteriia bacterium]